jgi:hypothetical protein
MRILVIFMSTLMFATWVRAERARVLWAPP